MIWRSVICLRNKAWMSRSMTGVNNSPVLCSPSNIQRLVQITPLVASGVGGAGMRTHRRVEIGRMTVKSS